MRGEKINLFALLNSEEDSLVRRIPLTGKLQEEISDYILQQKSIFYTDQEEVEFSGSYNADEGEIFCIQDYSMNDEITSALQNPLQFEVLNLKKDSQNIFALFAGKWQNKKGYICFQNFDSRKIISKGFTILFSGDTYKKLEDPGLTLQDRLNALYIENKLLFYSYHSTRRFLDLSAYYKEATDTDLDAFASNSLLQVDDRASFKENADSSVRKKVTLLLKNNVLEQLTLKDIKSTAKDYEVEIETKGKKLVIPSDKKKLKELLRFLDEDYFTSILTKRKCITNSKRYL